MHCIIMIMDVLESIMDTVFLLKVRPQKSIAQATPPITLGQQDRACTLKDVTMSSVLLVKTAVRGYHVYQVVWEPRRGDLCFSTRE